MRTRLADIAGYAGVSEATVSRVLNGKSGVSAATRQAVLTALDVLGYQRPSKLRRHSAGLVGLIVPELTNPIFPTFAQHIETYLARTGYTPVLCTQTPGGVHEDEYVQMLLDRGVASIIFISGLHADVDAGVDRYLKLRERGLPIVLINGYRPEVPAQFVSHDDTVSVQIAVKYLRDLGHTRIALAIGQERYVPVRNKIAAFREAMAEVLPAEQVDALIESTMFSVEGGMTAGQHLIEQDVTAVVCGSDLIALGVIRSARQMGVEVPRDLSVIGFDDSPLISFTDPPLTTIRQDVIGMSEASVRLMLEETDKGLRQNREYLFAPELVVRGSTGAAPSRTGTSHTRRRA